jgi:hypothetical protein
VLCAARYGLLITTDMLRNRYEKKGVVEPLWFCCPTSDQAKVLIMLPTMPFELTCGVVAAAASMSASAPSGEEAGAPLAKDVGCCMTCIATVLADPIFIDTPLTKAAHTSTARSFLPTIDLRSPRRHVSYPRPRTHWDHWSGLGANWMGSSAGRIEMADDLRRQLREVERALTALDGVVAVRREYVALRERVGWSERELAGLEALVDAAAKL